MLNAGMTDIQVLSVFGGPGGRGGNTLGVVRDGTAVRGDGSRQELAAELGYSETVFIDDAELGVVDIWTPSARLAFAGHPLVGVGWLLGADVLRPPAGEVPVRQDGDLTWVRGRAEWASGRRTERFASPAGVEALPAPPVGEGWLYAWAWQDEAAGRVRARAFPRRGDGVVEDEATGAAAMVLTHEQGRALDIRQGSGSQILTLPRPDGSIEVGGRARRVVSPSGGALG